ncbi:MAG: alkylmercury lyase family protein [Saprospiraceae bacterium]|nr:alkylmercury lyase family protein [Saprospiraceae bacterium]
MLNHSILHHAILDHIIKEGYAPEVASLAQLLSETEAEVERALYALQDYHGVVLHPNSPKVWVIHPFSLAPTNFLVSSRRGEWWGNCAWCSLGVAALLQEDVSIRTTSGAHGETLEIQIVDGQIQPPELLIHFPIPMMKAWDNVIYTCSTMLAFRTEAEIDKWCERHDIAKGDVQPLSHIWEFASKWYGQHLNPDWKKWTLQEAKEIFDEFGLTHPVWQLEISGDRF